MSKVIQCKVCKRAVYSNHVDNSGKCVLCAPAPVVAEPSGDTK